VAIAISALIVLTFLASGMVDDDSHSYD